MLGIDEKNRGYSSYYFDRNNTKDHCVSGEEDIYQTFRILVAVVLIIVPFGIAPGIPYLTVIMHENIHKWLTENDSDIWYYIRAMIICATLFDIVAVGIDIYTILSAFRDNTAFGDVAFYYFIALVLFVSFPLLNFVLAFKIIWFKHKARCEGSGEENDVETLTWDGPAKLVHCNHAV